MDTTTPGGRLVFPVFATLAEFTRELIIIGTRGASPPPVLATGYGPAEVSRVWWSPGPRAARTAPPAPGRSRAGCSSARSG
ncbi:hypothetical protein [Streptomyces prasinus]